MVTWIRFKDRLLCPETGALFVLEGAQVSYAPPGATRSTEYAATLVEVFGDPTSARSRFIALTQKLCGMSE